MGKNSHIQWTNDTWNPWQGCTKISPGCKHCYMYRDKQRFGQDPLAIVRSTPATFNAPLTKLQGPLVFTCSWSDFFLPEADAWRPEAWDIIRQTPHLTYQILTKRPELIPDRLPEDWGNGYANVWLGVSCETQQYADDRIPWLMKTPAAVRFVSAEPLLESIPKLWHWLGKLWECPHCGYSCIDERITATHHITGPPICKACHEFGRHQEVDVKEQAIDWVIVGGESGPKARPMHLAWVRDIRDQCQDAWVPFFMKQWGAWCPENQSKYTASDAIPGLDDISEDSTVHIMENEWVIRWEDNLISFRVGKKKAGRLLDGREWNAMPEISRCTR